MRCSGRTRRNYPRINLRTLLAAASAGSRGSVSQLALPEMRAPEQVLADLAAFIREDSPHGAALRVEVANAVHRMAVNQQTAAQATHMQALSRELHDLELWKRKA
jgi:hypothetical protein